MPSRNKKIRDTAKYYSAGSAAHSIEPIQYPDIDNTPMVIPKVRKKRKSAIERYKNKQQIKNKALYNLKFIFTSMVILFGCITIVMVDSMILEKQKNIKALTSELNNLKDENLGLKTKISEQIDLKNIEEIATKRLGMSKPSKNQMVYIDVPKSSSTVQYNVESEIKEEKTGFLKLFKEFITDVFGSGE